MIRVGKYDYKTKIQPTTESFTNVLIHTTQSLSPYVMKDENNVIMENYWQFSKIWKKYYKIRTPVSTFNVAETRWSYYDFDNLDNGEEYMKWRNAGFSHNKWVRYPNGHKHHNECVGSMTEDGRILNYIDARKEIYYKKYKEIATTLPAFKKLYNRTENIQINEVDGPSYYNEYPYNLVVNNSIEITPEILTALINNPRQAFGHGYALAACLLNMDF